MTRTLISEIYFRNYPKSTKILGIKSKSEIYFRNSQRIQHSGYYAIYGHYGRENFMELSKRLGLIEKRAERIIDNFQLKLAEMEQMVQRSFLPQELKEIYMKNVIDRLERIAEKG